MDMPDPLISLLIGLIILALTLALLWPRWGLIARWQRIRQLTNRILSEDALKYIQKAALKHQPVSLQSIAGALGINANQAAALLEDMQQRDLIALQEGEIRLTPTGRDYGMHIIRAHRLWEEYLAEETGYEETEWHSLADFREHSLSPAEAASLEQQLGHPTHDPHGDPIPTASGEVVLHGGMPLTALRENQSATIVHIEDEPEAVAAQLAAEGLYPGMQVHLTESTQKRVRFWANGQEHLLAPLVAANISIVPSTQAAPIEIPSAEPLTSLKPGQSGQVINISPRCRGPERRRLMDLGVLPGTLITTEMASPGGDPTAYRIRGALIALRREQAALINIQPLGETAQ